MLPKSPVLEGESNGSGSDDGGDIMMTTWQGASRLSITAIGVAAWLAFVACSGGESGGGGAASVAAPITGTFVDSPVNGLHYTSPPSNPAGGVTANGGQYQCGPGDTVTFDLGGRVIGTGQTCGELVTVVSVFGATSITDLRVRNLAQLLLTLSGIPAGTQPIELPADIPASLPVRLDFADPNFEQMLQAALPNRTLASQDQVVAHLRTSFTTLTVAANGGRITSTPAGLVCTARTCSYDFVRGTQVTLAAIGTGFTGWNGDGCTGAGTCQILLTATQAIRAVFVAPPLVPVPFTGLPSASAIVDVNGDGKNDILIGFQGASDPVHAMSDLVLLNDGGGRGFTVRSLPRHYFGVNAATINFEPGDFNGDGNVDVLVINVITEAGKFYTSAKIQLFLGHGDGTFDDASADVTAGLWPLSPPYLADGGRVYGWPSFLRVVDIDGDGHLDFVAAAITGGGYIYRNDGTGKFAPVSMTLTTDFSSGSFKALARDAGDVLVGDLNHDGKPDLFAPYRFGVHQAFLNTSSPGSISFTVRYSPITTTLLMGALLDVNGDGFLDVVGSSLNTTPNSVPIVAYLGNGAGIFAENNTVFSPVQPRQVSQRQYLTADFNDDGRQDLFIADHGYDQYPFPGAPNVLLINQGGLLVDRTQTNLDLIPAFTHGAAIGDLNGDRRVDLILNNNLLSPTGGPDPIEPMFWLNDGTGKFTSYNPVIHQ